jgi:glycerol-3-phosphate dehydrogenase
MNTLLNRSNPPLSADLLVIGGGINGAGIARDAAGRGLSVLLCEQGDLGEGTSSRSSKLIHGGLRYLEHGEFRLVREALIEREVLLANAPHLIRPMRFVMPQDAQLRSARLVRLGLWLYDHLGGRERLPGTRRIDLRQAPEGLPLKDAYAQAFEYSDCWVDDARLVLLNALDAQARGATILTRTAFVGASHAAGRWQAQLRDTTTGAVRSVTARALVNAAGPWVEQVLQGLPQVPQPLSLRLVKGSHIVVPKFWAGPQAYLLQHTDRRVVFMTPYEGAYALIGTTEMPYQGDAAAVQISEAEISYLCEVVNRYLRQPIQPSEVVYAFAGVRPLYDDHRDNPSAVTRDYFFALSGSSAGGPPPLLSIYGGKITTFRQLAEHALQKLAPFLPPMRAAWTAAAALPGGDLPGGDFDAALQAWRHELPWMPAAMAERWLHNYGTRARLVLGEARSLMDLGRDFGGTLTEREVAYLRQHEWARSADDILWRRSKCGLHMSAAQRQQLADWLGEPLNPPR